MCDSTKIPGELRIRSYTSLPDVAREIRITVFVEEQGFVEEFDTTDGESVHFVAFDGETAVGTCRVFKTENEQSYTLGRLAVSKHHRKKGIGRALLSAAEEYAQRNGATELILHAQCAAQSFYEKCGFTAYGEIEYEQDSPHTWMKKAYQNPIAFESKHDLPEL